MDSSKVGHLILCLRKEKNMTQRQLAETMGLSDRTISKWERGLGCPDVSLLPGLSALFGVNIEKLLAGDLGPNDTNGGNMRKIKFYVCPSCGAVLFGTGEAEISCCGRRLAALPVQKEDEAHAITVEKVEQDYYVTLDHEMSKEHYISFVAYVSYDRVLLVKLYAEQDAAVRLPQMQGRQLFVYCTRHGLWEKRIAK